MNKTQRAAISTKWIVSCRGKKNDVNPLKPYVWLVEKERNSSGEIEDTSIIFFNQPRMPFSMFNV